MAGDRAWGRGQPPDRQPGAGAAGADTQKKTLQASERDRPDVAEERAAFLAGQAALDASRLVFLDETGSDITMTRTHGRAPRGKRLYGTVPHNRGKNLTVVGAISAEGVLCHWALDGGLRGESFLAFAVEVLIPALRRGDTVVMDNLSAHKTKAVRAAFAAAGIGVLYLPRYAPELNPIELCWSKVKGRLRAVGARTRARTREALRVAVAEALATVSAEEVRAWIRHCGYSLTST